MQRTIAQLDRIAEGREAEIFAWEPGTVLKLFRGTEWQRAADVQAAAMRAVKAGGGPGPAFHDIIEFDGRPGIVMERIEGVDLLTEIGKKPWKIVSAGGIMGRTHAALHRIPGPPDVVELKHGLRMQMEQRPGVPEDLRAFAFAALDRLPEGDRLLHGDFHPANIMLTPHGPVVIDWPNAVRGDPMADVARSILTIKIGELPPGASAPLRLLEKIGRKILLRDYRNTYRKNAAYDDARVEAWMTPVAAHRLTEGIENERPKLIALLEKRRPQGT